MMVLLQKGFVFSKKAQFFEIIGTRVILLGFLNFFRNNLNRSVRLEIVVGNFGKTTCTFLLL